MLGAVGDNKAPSARAEQGWVGFLLSLQKLDDDDDEQAATEALKYAMAISLGWAGWGRTPGTDQSTEQTHSKARKRTIKKHQYF